MYINLSYNSLGSLSSDELPMKRSTLFYTPSTNVVRHLSKYPYFIA